MQFPQLLNMFLAGTFGGLALWKLKVPSGALMGAMIGVVVYKYFTRSNVEFPHALGIPVQILIGISIGALFQIEMVHELKVLFWSVVFSCFALVLAGLLFSFILIKAGVMDVPTAYLSTSPGAMTAMIGLAMDTKGQLPVVMTFHFFRISFVIVTAPAILSLVRLLLGKNRPDVMAFWPLHGEDRLVFPWTPAPCRIRQKQCGRRFRPPAPCAVLWPAWCAANPPLRGPWVRPGLEDCGGRGAGLPVIRKR